MIYLFCGKKGSGKSLSAINYLYKKRKKYTNIYSNFPVFFTKKIDSYNWVNFRFEPGSAILIDEAQLFYNSREFSKLTKSGIGNELLDFLTMCRHYELDIYFITQSVQRIDLQIRELSDEIIFIKKTFKIFGRPIITFGFSFFDILELERYLNPNNFSKDFKFNYKFNLINKKVLKLYNTKYIDKNYILKDLYFGEKWT